MSRELRVRAWAVAAGTGDVLMSRLREGRANTVRGAAHFSPPIGLSGPSLPFL